MSITDHWNVKWTNDHDFTSPPNDALITAHANIQYVTHHGDQMPYNVQLACPPWTLSSNHAANVRTDRAIATQYVPDVGFFIPVDADVKVTHNGTQYSATVMFWLLMTPDGNMSGFYVTDDVYSAAPATSKLTAHTHDLFLSQDVLRPFTPPNNTENPLVGKTTSWYSWNYNQYHKVMVKLHDTMQSNCIINNGTLSYVSSNWVKTSYEKGLPDATTVGTDAPRSVVYTPSASAVTPRATPRAMPTKVTKATPTPKVAPSSIFTGSLLYQKLLRENEKINKYIDLLKTQQNTDMQRILYNDPKLQRYTRTYNVLFFLYFMVLLFMAYILFMIDQRSSTWYKVLLVLLFLAFPFVIRYVETALWNWGMFMYRWWFSAPIGSDPIQQAMRNQPLMDSPAHREEL